MTHPASFRSAFCSVLQLDLDVADTGVAHVIVTCAAGEQLPAQALFRLSMATEVDPAARLLEVCLPFYLMLNL